MQRQIEKFPYKKSLYLQWYEAAIANLILFKHLKDKFANHVYFLISDQGVLLKATSTNYLKNAEEEIDRFFSAKIQQLQISCSSDFYQNILTDIKEQTQKLKDTRDCPYINLVYSQKLRNSCLSLKRFGYTKPYQNWEVCERERKGFCYLIVRPQHRWKQIANNVLALVKKRESSSLKAQTKNNWTIQMNYERFVWLYLYPQFQKLKAKLQVKQKKAQNSIQVIFQQNAEDCIDFQKIINGLSHRYYEEKPSVSDKQLSKIHVLSSLQLQKITQLIYHQFGLPNLVREIRCKGPKFLAVGPNNEVQALMFPDIKICLQEKLKIQLRQDIEKIKDEQAVGNLVKLGKRHDIVSYRGLNYVMVKYQVPLKNNVQNFLKYRLPSLPRYFYCIQRSKQLYLFRKFKDNKFRNALESSTLHNQIFLINSLILIVKQLHKREIFVGTNFNDNIFVQGLRIIIEPGEIGSKEQDKSKVILLVRQWVKGLKNGDLKTSLQKLNDPSQMLPLFQEMLSDMHI